MKQNRFKSPVLWAALVANALAVLVLVGIVDVQISDTVKIVSGIILESLTLLGILNNPTDSTNI